MGPIQCVRGEFVNVRGSPNIPTTTSPRQQPFDSDSSSTVCIQCPILLLLAGALLVNSAEGKEVREGGLLLLLQMPLS